MIFERRVYTLKPGNADAFWALQREWNTPALVPGYLAHCIGYFSTLAGPAEEIVHLYRHESLDAWKPWVFNVYTPERMPYFADVRSLMLAQENMFLVSSPIPQMNPIWDETRDWFPGVPLFPGAGNPGGIVVVETTLELFPGALPAFWDACRAPDLLAEPAVTANLIGTFYMLVGPLHRVLIYRWYANAAAADAHHAQLDALPQWRRFVAAYRPLVARNHVAYLRPSPVSWMRALFEPVGPYDEKLR